jgi:hypothetical protein
MAPAAARGVLRLIASQPDHRWRRTRRELADQLGIAPEKLAEIIDYLESEGLVRRQPGKRYHIRLVEDDEIFEDYDERYLGCRDRRHAWENVNYYIGSLGGVHRWMICDRCGTEKDEHEMGGVIQRVYHYPQGYQLLGHKVTHQQVRDAVFSRAKVHRSREEMLESIAS